MTHRTFQDLGVSPRVADALARRGITTPFPIQTMVVPDALAGRDVLGRSQTGSGKTLAFALPIVERLGPDVDASGNGHARQKGDVSGNGQSPATGAVSGNGGRAKSDRRPAGHRDGHAGTSAQRPVALVLVPTRELATQVAAEFADVAKARGLHVAAAYGGVSIREQSKAVSRADVLIATPGRLEDLANRKLVRLEHVRILVLDEADRMLDMGFQPQVDAIVRRLPRERQTMFFSATLDGETGRLAKAYTRDARRHEVESGRQTVEEADHRFVPVTEHDKVAALVDLLRTEGGPALVFVRTKRGADRLVSKLRPHGIEAEAMHGDMTQSARERALARFTKGKVATLVATDVAARGLDVTGIRQVVNFDPPKSHEDYVHRVGRTARAGREGTGVTLVLPDQHGDVSRIARQLELHEEFEEGGLTIAPPRLVFASRKGRRSQLAGRRGRRF